MTEDQSVLGTTRGSERAEAEERTFSLMEVAQETGIAMPILLRYKREHPDRIPSTGSGAQQRFPEAAFAVFEEIHAQESESHDRPRGGGFGLLSLPRIRRAKQEPQDAGEGEPVDADEAPASEKTPGRAQGSPTSAAPPGEATLTLKDISEQLGIPYPTIARYATKHEDRIPHEGTGRGRRFPPEAVKVFRRIRKESKPGRPKKSESKRRGKARPARAAAGAGRAGDDGGLAARLEQLESRQQRIEDMVRELLAEVRRPLVATVRRS